MEVEKGEWKILRRAIDEWEQAGNLTKDQANDLRNSIDYKQRERQQIAQYFFSIALFCALLAFGAIFLNEKLLEKIKLYFSWNDLVISCITAILSILWFWYIGRKRKNISTTVYEIYMVLGGLSVLTTLIYICKQITNDTNYITFLTLSFLLLPILSLLFRSKALWIGAIAAFIGWFGEFSIFHSSNNLFLGMNYPVRYTVLGLMLVVLGLLQGLVKPLSFTKRITYTSGLFLLFSGLWGVSVFGNYNTLTGWEQVRQIHVVAYAVLFGIASVISFYLGIRYKDDLARDFGVIFLLINLYTRYFEYFWDAMNKGIFFLILAITFGLVGRWLERNNRKRRKINSGKQP